MNAFFPNWVIMPKCSTKDFKALLHTYSQSTDFWVNVWKADGLDGQYSCLFRITQGADGVRVVQDGRVFCFITLAESTHGPRVTAQLSRSSSEDRNDARQFWQGFQQYLKELNIHAGMVESPTALQADRGAVAEKLTPAEDEGGKKHGPTVKTQIRAKVFKQLKDEHPEWSQAKAAIEACHKLGEYVTADTVRNAYRAMGWEWKRADRIR